MMLPANINLGQVLDPTGRESDIAVIDERGSHSYGALDDAANRVAADIRQRGFGRGDRVSLFGENSAEYVAFLFGVMRAGCVAVPISTRQPPAAVADMIARTRVKLAFADAAVISAFPGEITCAELESSKLAKSPVAHELFRPGDNDIAELLFTSGSTGRPRAVSMHHRGQIWFLNMFLGATGRFKDTVLVAAPLYHSNAQIRVNCAFACGGTVLLQKRFVAEDYLGAIARHGVTLMSGVPAMYEMVVRLLGKDNTADFPSVRRIMIGSAAAPEPLTAALGNIFPNASVGVAYGLTEAGGTVCNTLYRPDDAHAPPGSVGKLLPGVEVRFEGGGDEGVLYLRSPCMSPGYDNDPTQNAARFVDGWLRSDDVLRRDENGYFYFRGRADDMFVVGGENVYPIEVENAIGSHPAVHQVAVVASNHPIKGAVPFAFVVPRKGASVTAQDIKDHVLQNGPAYRYPRQVVFVDALPLNGIGKVDYPKLRAAAITPSE